MVGGFFFFSWTKGEVIDNNIFRTCARGEGEGKGRGKRGKGGRGFCTVCMHYDILYMSV